MQTEQRNGTITFHGKQYEVSITVTAEGAGLLAVIDHLDSIPGFEYTYNE